MLTFFAQSWQQKLSSLGVAHFPWDPPQQQTPPPSQPSHPILPPTTTVPSNAPQQTPALQQLQTTPQPLQHLPATEPPVSHGVGNIPVQTPISQPQIKTEPGVNGLPPVTSIPQTMTNAQAVARERAVNNLQSKYGPAAANSVSQLQAQGQAALSLPGQQRPLNGQPSASMPDVKSYNYQYATTQQQQQPPPPPQRMPYQPPQTDGASDGSREEALAAWKAEVARRREAARRFNGEADRLLMEQLRLQSLSLEGGGLLTSLDEQPSSTLSRRRAASPGPAAHDGPDEDDEDAINSDLDDPDDLANEDQEGEDAIGQVMLCTYDKVQRVKNKWKCTLKDGILSTGGKE